MTNPTAHGVSVFDGLVDAPSDLSAAIARVRKRPVVVEAIQYGASTCATICEWMGIPHVVYGGEPCGVGGFLIETLEGIMTASPGDWIIKGVKGEFYPCKPDIFATTYEPAAAKRASTPSKPVAYPRCIWDGCDLDAIYCEGHAKEAVAAPLTPSQEPVAWRVRARSRLSSLPPSDWRYVGGRERPAVNSPNDCDMEPLYAAPPAPERAAAPTCDGCGKPVKRPTFCHDCASIAPGWKVVPAQAEPQEGDLLHTMMEWARTEEGRKQLADAYRPRLWACAKRVADPQNEAATCRHWCGDIEHCQPIASAPAQAEPQHVSVSYELPAHAEPQPDSSTAANAAQQEQHDDNDGASADRRQQSVRGVSVERTGQAAGIPGDGQAGGVRDPVHQRGAECGRAGGRGFPLLIDNNTLRKQIAADPDDEPSAGSVDEPPADALVEEESISDMLSRHDRETRAAILRAHHKMIGAEAKRDAVERQMQTFNAVVQERDAKIVEATERAERAESALAAANKDRELAAQIEGPEILARLRAGNASAKEQFDVANSLAYLWAQNALLSQTQDECRRLRDELAEVKRPLDAQMARLNRTVTEKNNELARTESALAAAEGRERALRRALTELVACKDIKDQADYNLLYAQTTGSIEEGKRLTEEYRRRKVDAWRDARAALAAKGAGE